MHAGKLLLATSLTLLGASARWIDGDARGPSTAGETPQSPAAAGDPLVDRLFAEVGTWDLEITDHVRGTDRTQSSRGVETCAVGPGRKWLLCDMTITRSKGEISTHIVLGYSAHHGRYFGALVDNFGGAMELFTGKPGADPKCRVLESRLLGSEVEDPSRFTMRWISDDERYSVLEVPDGDGWILLREFRHLRRK